MVQWVKDLAVVTAVAWVAAVVQIRSLAQEPPHATRTAKKTNKQTKKPYYFTKSGV